MPADHKTLTSPNGDVKTLLTFHFAHTFLSRGDRTIDQMVQAARSGKQNIAEGSAAGVTSTGNTVGQGILGIL